MGNARSNAIARQDAEIEASTQRAIAVREEKDRPRNALEALSSRLQISPSGLKKTLMNTAFRECKNEEQFMALIVVANEYDLNPLLKEIYAFPAKGGAIVPMVSIDGWISLMNRHPQFDGIEFDYINDEKGQIEAIEAIIHRKDRTHPVKVIEYLDENFRPTEPWKMMKRRMLRHRALIQGARVAFGFTGIVGEGDEETINGGDLRSVPSLPSSQNTAEYLDDEIPQDFSGQADPETGEVAEDYARDPQTGMTEVDEDTNRRLDAGEVAESEEQATESESEARLRLVREQIAAAKTMKGIQAVDVEWANKYRLAYDDATAAEIDKLITTRMNALREG